MPIPLRAVFDGRIHVEPLEFGLLASYDHVHVVAGCADSDRQLKANMFASGGK